MSKNYSAMGIKYTPVEENKDWSTFYSFIFTPGAILNRILLLGESILLLRRSNILMYSRKGMKLLEQSFYMYSFIFTLKRK